MIFVLAGSLAVPPFNLIILGEVAGDGGAFLALMIALASCDIVQCLHSSKHNWITRLMTAINKDIY